MHLATEENVWHLSHVIELICTETSYHITAKHFGLPS